MICILIISPKLYIDVQDTASNFLNRLLSGSYLPMIFNLSEPRMTVTPPAPADFDDAKTSPIHNND